MTAVYDAMRQYARSYQTHHLVPIPLQPNGKAPLLALEELTSFLDARIVDDRVIDDWQQRWPDANAGLVTGRHGLHVIDIDDAEIARDWQQTPPDSSHWRVQTPNGLHIYMRPAHPLGNRRLVRRLEDQHVLVESRGVSWYVVAPPSTIDGVAYTWQHGWTEPLAWLDDATMHALLARLEQSTSLRATPHSMAPHLTPLAPGLAVAETGDGGVYIQHGDRLLGMNASTTRRLIAWFDEWRLSLATAAYRDDQRQRAYEEYLRGLEIGWDDEDDDA